MQNEMSRAVSIKETAAEQNILTLLGAIKNLMKNPGMDSRAGNDCSGAIYALNDFLITKFSRG